MVQPVTDGSRRPDYRRAPGDAAATGTLLRLATCIEGHVEVVANVVPIFEYGVQTGMWDYDGDGYDTMTVRPPVGDPVLTVNSTIRLGAVGARCYGRSTLEKGESAFVALSWSGHRPADLDEAQAAARRHRRLLAGLALQRHVPRPSLAQLHGAQRPDAQGPELRAHRRRHGGRDDLAARDARRGAQLGLPLHLDPRLLLHAALALPARVRLGGPRVLRLHHRGDGRGERRLRAADHVRHRRSQGPDRADPRPPVGLAELAAGPGRQRRLGPAPERRLGHAPRRGGHPPARRARRRSSSRCGRAWPRWWRPPSRTRATPTRASGRSGAIPSTSRPPRSCAGWPWTAAPTWPGSARTPTGPRRGARRPTN